MSFSASETNVLSVQSQVADAVTVPSYKWFSLQDNVLDGTYHPMDSSLASQVGWWGTVLSDGSGIISSNPAITVTLTGTVRTIQVTGDSLLNEYPVDFTVQLYNGASLLYTKTVTGNAVVNYTFAIGTSYDITSAVVTVTKVNKAGRSVKLLEAFSMSESFASTDILLPKTSDVSTGVTNQLASVDTMLPKTIDVSTAVTNQLVSVDTLLPKTIDASFFTQYEIWTIDTLLPKIADVSTAVTNTFASTDILLPKTADVSTGVTNQLFSTDIILPSENVEIDAVTANLFTTDSLLTNLTESKSLVNIHSVMDGNMRQTFARVIITYSSPFLDANIVATANQTAYNTVPQQTADSVSTPLYKWFQLGDNVLDGTYHPIDGTGVIPVGWWATTISNGSGVLSTAAVLTVTFGARPVYTLLVVGDSLLNEYPVDFTIKLYDVSSVLLFTQTVTGNTLVTYTANIAVVSDVCSIVLSVTKINKANTSCKIVEFYTAVQETYEGDQILSLRLLEEQVYDNQSLPIGNVSSNEVDIRLANTNGYFDAGNLSSPIRTLLKRNRKVQVFLGAAITPGVTEWYPMGTFWTLDWKAPRSELYIDLTARDKLELMRSTTFTTSPVYVNKSVYFIVQAILTDYGMISTDYSLDAALSSTIIPYAWFDRVSHREALSQLVAASLARCYCDRTGVLIITAYVPPTYPMYTYTEDTSIVSFSNPLMWSQIVNYVEVTSSPRVLATSTTVYQDASGVSITVPAGGTLVQTYYFNTVPCTTILTPTFTANVAVTISATTVYAWGIDVTFSNSSGTSYPVTNVVVMGQPLNIVGSVVVVAKDDVNIRDNSKQQYTLTNNFIQDTTTAQTIANSILATYKDPRHDATVESRGHASLRLGDRVKIPDYGSATYTDYFIVRQSTTWDGTLSATVDAQRIGSG